jgi:outer membrane protein assembly factor BamD
MRLSGTIHMKKRFFLNWAIVMSISLSLLFGCGGKGKGVKSIEGNPETLYKQGLALFNKRDYSKALEKFKELKSSFPDSPPYTLWAELKVGDCLFFKEEYVEAIAAYEEFKKVHPSHEEMPYVQYQIGMSYFNQIHTFDRDQTPTRKALSNFEYLVTNYPPSIFVEKAKERIGICKKRLADHEFYIGNYYYKHGKYQAAAWRFEGLLEKFPKDPDEDKTLYYLGKSYLELEQWENATLAFMKIVTEYPQSSYRKEVRAILEKDLSEKKVSFKKTKESKKKDEVTGSGSEYIPFVGFEEEGKQPISLTQGKKVELKREETKKEEVISKVEIRQKIEKVTPLTPQPEDRSLPPRGNPVTTEQVKKGTPLETKEANLMDRNQPINITSDKVEAYRKDNLIVFKGNVIARQRDIVIYADSLEAVIVENGKGIEQVTAEGDVKIQQGLRVANCRKAIFYNLDQKIVLTGDPKVSDGDNIVSGNEIIFDIEKNQIEVKGGSSGRGKAKIQPGEGIEKLK